MSEFRREIEPPVALEDRVVASLRRRGLLGSSRYAGARRAGAAIAAGIVLFLAGYAAGASQIAPVPPGAPSTPRFMLLLHETAATASTGVPEDQLVDEYRRWARGVGAGGTPIQGEKLKIDAGQTLSGFFIIAAPSRQAAETVAASCPHARYGGRIEIREIDPT